MGVTESLNQMVIGLREMIDIVLVIVILFLILIILKLVEKGYNVRLELRKKDRNFFYRKELMRLRGSGGEPVKVLDKLNVLVRGFFKEAFDLDYHLEYLEMAQEFKKRGSREGVSFCSIISELNYSGEVVTQKKVDVLLDLLEKIMKSNKILSQEEKNLLEKKKLLNKTVKLGTAESKKADKSISEIIMLKRISNVKRKDDLNRINWKYKLRIIFLKIRGKIPQIKKRNLGRKDAVS